MSSFETANYNEIKGTHKFRNNAKAIEISNKHWEKAKENNLTHLKVKVKGRNELYNIKGTDKEVINLCSFSYLGLNSHPDIIQAAIDALHEESVLHLGIVTLRIRLGMKQRVEDELSDLYNTTVIQVLSASVANAGILPVLASGHLSDGKPLAMVFDRFCHFSMAYVKPICADEAPVFTCPNNDLNYIEDMCKKYPRVAYVTDGVYSMGGIATLKGLLDLQEKYGLFLYFDDSHSISIKGKHGEGYIASQLDEINDRTVIVGSLGKGFGASGGMVLLGPGKHADILRRYGGPMGWSQDMNVAGLGAILGSIKIHRSPELGQLQQKLQDNIALFDKLIPNEYAGNGFPIRIVKFGAEEEAIRASKAMFEQGFYTAPVYFPIVERGKAGIRIMIRANIDQEDIVRLCDSIKSIAGKIQQERGN